MTARLIGARVLDTEMLPPDDRQAAYLAEIDGALTTTFIADPPFVRLTTSYVGPIRIARVKASARRSERTPALIARDRQDGVDVQLAVSGRATGEAAGRFVQLVPGSILLLDRAQPATILDHESRTVIEVAVPQAMLAPHVADLRVLHGRVLGPEAGGMLAAYLRELAPRLANLPVHAGPVLGTIIVDLLLLALDHDPSAVALASGDRRETLLDRATRLVDGRLASEELTPEWLAAKLTVSRSELYAAFEQAGGVARFIWRRRLEAAQAALLDPNDARRIGEIAFAFGFSSEAHFARAFRAAFGRTATETRRSRADFSAVNRQTYRDDEQSMNLDGQLISR